MNLKKQLAINYAGDEHQPEYHAFLAGWDAVIRKLKEIRKATPNHTGYPDDLADKIDLGEL